VTSGARRGRAQSLVEFALVIPLFLGLTLLTVEAGRLMLVWSLLSEATREAARTAVLPSTTSTAPVVTSALQLTSWFGVTSSNVTVYANGTPVSGAFAKRRGDAVSVSISYTYTLFIVRPLGWQSSGSPFASLSMPVQTVMRAEG
jgi:Flp pilus assembly protein TadG